MDPSPTQKAKMRKDVVAACEELRSTILGFPQLSNVFRDIYRGLRLWGCSSPTTDFDDLKKAIESDEWATELEAMRGEIERGGNAILELVAARLELSTPAPFLVAARFLKLTDGVRGLSIPIDLDQCAEWPPGIFQAADVLCGFRSLSTKLRPRASELLRHLIDRIIGPISPTLPVNALHHTLNSSFTKARWDVETREVGELFKNTWGQLRTVATKNVTLKGGLFAWRAAEAFILGWPIKKGELTFERDTFRRKWLPECYPAFGSNSRERPSTGREPLDERNTMDPHNKVRTPGTGHSKKPGSHNDNRGHK